MSARKKSPTFLFLIFLIIRAYRAIKGPFIFFLLAGTFLIVGLWEGLKWHRFAHTSMLPSGFTTIVVQPNTTLKQLATELHDRGLLPRPRFFMLLARQMGDSNKLRVGEFAVTPETTPETLLNNIASGKVVMRKMTLVEGITMRQIRDNLLANAALQHVAVKQTDQEIMSTLGHPGIPSEGHFFPDTYVYTWGNKDLVILQQAFNRMQNLLNQEWQQRQADLPYQTPEEALIVASLVESEAVLPAERPIIAGVIVRRLQKNMNLQIDPTIIYGVGKPYGSVITLEDLRNDNPYNTYLHKGLPPTPINMPSAASIYAALHPTPGDTLYYVAKGDGGHQFSATYPEHLQAVQKYRQYKKSEVEQQKWMGLALFIFRSLSLY